MTAKSRVRRMIRKLRGSPQRRKDEPITTAQRPMPMPMPVADGLSGLKLPKMFFDEAYYRETYPDVSASRHDPFTHFVEVGRAEGRHPSAGFRIIEPALRQRLVVSKTPYRDIVSLFPAPKRSGLGRSLYWTRLRAMIHPRLYAAQLGDGPVLTVDEAFDHFLAQGAFDDLRVSALFHPEWYLEQLDRRGMPRPGRGVHPFFHWLTAGWKNRVVPTPLFDEEFYLEANPDVARTLGDEWSFLHFVKSGCYEPGRRPSTAVAKAPAGGLEARDRQDPLLLAQLLAPSSTAAPPVDLRQSSRLEDTAALLGRRVERLRSPEVRALVEKAAAIEPLILRPYGPREASLLPLKHALASLKDQAEAMRQALPASHFDTVVLVPHCRMAGSARVTGAFTHALSAVDPDSSVILLTTDLPDFDRPDWFSDRVVVFDISRFATALTAENKVRLLLDVVRGLTPQRVINVNSRLGWDLFKVYGKQLASMTELGSYLFTWDLDQRGNKGGYPITYFQDCFAFLRWVLLDNETLRDELVERYAMSATLQRKLFVAHTPVETSVIDHSGVFESRREDGRILRAFWGGRFDRQKRFDLVIDIARAMPQLEIWAWGKTILGGLDIDFDALPPNIRLQGTYRHFDDLPVESCDFFLYTSEWDGLPTILLDAGIRGVATVASAVGGVTEVVTEDTGFPVGDPLDAGSYVAAIKQMAADPPEVTRRAKAFRAHVQRQASEALYRDAVRSALGGSAATAPSDARELGPQTAPGVTA